MQTVDRILNTGFAVIGVLVFIGAVYAAIMGIC
jgi:hypothetical protein